MAATAVLYVGWTGSTGAAAAKDMIVGYSTDKGQHIVKLSSGEHSPQNEGPTLVADLGPSGILIASADGRARNTLTRTHYSGIAFGCRTSFTGFTTPHAPALAVDSAGADKSSVQVRRLVIGGGRTRLAPAVRRRAPP